MEIQTQTLSEQEQKAIICICVLAAFADGAQHEVERAQIDHIVKGFSEGNLDLVSAYQDVLGGKLTLPQVADQLQGSSAKALAYEMAACVCNSDGALNELEKKFLADLRQRLQLDIPSTEAYLQTTQAIVDQPLAAPVPPAIDASREADLDRMILNASILNGALEIMPQTLATMAVVPLQMRLVYQIGKRYGYELDRRHIGDFLATVGIGLSSQVFEGFARKLVSGFARGMAGKFLGGLAGQATGSAFAFATTYALGQLAKRYYSGGRTLSTEQLKESFSSLLDNARSLQNRYSGEIVQKSRQINISQLLPLIKQQQQP
ncbi:MAG TPA: TerB family tellurite resistance protein [Clostridia bacterium]|nr:TerB family tellurite resistance protein [Clostridia bacterium]